MQKCSKCQINKNLTEYTKDRSKKGGYAHYCKQCKKENYRKMHLKNGQSYNEQRKITDNHRYELGLCRRCGEVRLLSQRYCKLHFVTILVRNIDPKEFKDNQHVVRAIFEKLSNICPYTGAPLMLGVNASLDHILPQLTHPELKWDIDNIEWVDRVYNFAKYTTPAGLFNRHYKITYIP